MSFTGNLEHLPLVDVMQLLHTTRKSGILSIKGRKGESKIVFSDGSIVGASHLNGKYLVGGILVGINAITPEVLEQTLKEQENAGAKRKPLIATLIEKGRISVEDARKGLKQLIEMTVVELVGWKKGVFTLDIEVITISDDCSYSLAEMSQEISLDTQMVLMDALRVFDEKRRDGVPEDEDDLSLDNEWTSEVADLPGQTAGCEETAAALSEDDLGLADLDQLERKIPEVFSSIKTIDPAGVHRQIISETLSDFSGGEQEQLVSFLSRFSGSAGDDLAPDKQRVEQSQAVIVFSRDEFIKHSIMTVCKNERGFAFDTSEKDALYHRIDYCISNRIMPLLVFDSPEESAGGFPEDEIAGLRKQAKEKYPQVSTIQLVSPLDRSFSLKAFDDGVRAVLPKPSKETHKDTFVEDTIRFLETFSAYVRRLFNEQEQSAAVKLKDNIVALRKCEGSQDVLSVLLAVISDEFERAITFVRKNDLVGVRGKGIDPEKGDEVMPATWLKIPLSEPSVVSNLAEGGDAFWGEGDDEVLRKQIFEEIGAPRHLSVLLLPIRSRGKMVALVYGDFGNEEVAPVQLDLLEVIASQAGLVLENLLYRKQLENNSQ